MATPKSAKGANETATPQASIKEELKAVLARLTPDELVRFNATSGTDKKELFLEAVDARKSALDAFGDTEFESAPDGEDDIHIFAVPTANNAGDIKAGDVIVGELLGYMPMWSREKKKNWDKHDLPNGVIFYSSGYYRFRNPKTNVEFGIYSYSNLWELQKVPTLTTEGVLKPAKNPLVRIEYVGLVEGAENLAKYGVETDEGDTSHIFAIGYEKGLKVNKFQKGCINMMRSPLPNLGSKDKESLNALTRMAMDYAQTKGISLNSVFGRETESVAQQYQAIAQ